jgi:hypothetical protein
MNPAEAYLTELRDIRASGAAVPETSGYGALANLLNEVGAKLKPKVRCLINLQNAGAGIPDGGLFTASQFPKGGAEPLSGQLPARGAIEAKPVGDDARVVAESEQVRRYLEKYRQVLVTTYREFVLVGFNADGEAASLESFSLAAAEQEFWALAAHPGSDAARQAGERLTDFLRRVLLRQAQIAAPKDLAWFLASYAREARARAEERDLPNWVSTRKALEEALGLSFSGEKGEHFFRSTLVQTLFYGLFAAWVFWAEHHPPTDAGARFRWREAAGYLHIPILQKLFYDFSNPGALGLMRIDEVLDWAAEALNRVDRAAFFSTFEQSHAVQYFYEPFLEAFDPQLRKDLGVWYTPPEIVQYMVARVDTVLREELNIADGLADPRVVVLDPCCGTGAYLVEVLNKIAATLAEKSGGVDALAAHEIKQAAMSRVYGFEILPAPFVISHLQIGMLLHRLGAPFADESDERAGVYLTNALTGWEPPTEPKQHLLFTEMEEERDKAQAVKQHAPILVILGNPPYNGFAGVSPEEEEGLLDTYKQGLRDWGITKNYLDDLYVRFFRLAERRIAEGPERAGVVCFISNYSWLGEPTYVVVRQHLLESFDKFWVENMHGDRRISEYALDGRTSETVFAIAGLSPGIQQGTAISLWVKQPRHCGDAEVLFRNDFTEARAAERRARLLSSLDDGQLSERYVQAHPSDGNRFAFWPTSVAPGYESWPSIVALTRVPPMLGMNENRGQALYASEPGELRERMRLYYDPDSSDEALATLHPGLTTDAAGFVAVDVRKRLLGESTFDETNIVPAAFRPLDERWAYVERRGGLWNRVRPELQDQAWDENVFLVCRCKANKAPDGSAFLMLGHLADQHILSSDGYFIPVWLRRVANEAQTSLLPQPGESEPATSNLSAEARTYIAGLGQKSEESGVGLQLWLHVLAIGYSPVYILENADGMRRDFPRIPLPATRDALLASAELGRTVAALLDVEEPVHAVTTGSVRHELRPLGVLTSVSGGQLDPSAGDLAVIAGWGHGGKGGVTMPGRGRTVERPYTDGELALFREGLSGLGLSYDQLTACLGGACCDVYLNDVAYWRCVPARVWKYTIGGYQVMKKWLSYRERALLGRDLKPDEARYVTEMTRRIAAILLLEPALDENYERVQADTYPWPGG